MNPNSISLPESDTQNSSFHTWRKYNPIKTLIVLACLLCCGNAWAESKPNVNLLADSILQAEGNDNYGILAVYKRTSPRQACINTIRSKWSQWTSNSKLQAQYPEFIDYLASKYAPIGVSNDPEGLNKHWARNVRYWYRQFNKQAESAQ